MGGGIAANGGELERKKVQEMKKMKKTESMDVAKRVIHQLQEQLSTALTDVRILRERLSTPHWVVAVGDDYFHVEGSRQDADDQRDSAIAEKSNEIKRAAESAVEDIVVGSRVRKATSGEIAVYLAKSIPEPEEGL